ncbi:MAG: hypothetical protein ACI4KM_00630 [Oscillospiraceae bacterium]
MEYKRYQRDIQRYCENNNLDFSKVERMVKGCGDNDIIIQARIGKNSMLGLLDETPMPVVLRVRRKPDGSLIFEQTEHTKRYLA